MTYSQRFMNSRIAVFVWIYLNNFFLQQQLFAIFITRQLTGNIKESLIPYINISWKQIKIIDKTKNSNLALEKNQDLIKNLAKLRQYSINYRNFKQGHKTFTSQENKSKESSLENLSSENSLENISQPEVESLMPEYPDTFDDYLGKS